MKFSKENNNNWKGGRINNNGYVMLLKPEHRFKDNKGYVFEHRLVYEQYHKCSLLPWTAIHHINHTRNDNRIENLEPCISNGKHLQTYHRYQGMDKRICHICKSDKTYSEVTKGRGDYIRYYWHKDAGKWLCNNCYARQKYHRRKERNARN